MNNLDPRVLDSLVGIIRVDFSLLSFCRGREKDGKIIEHLQGIYQGSSEGCDQDEEDYFIPARINKVELEEILRTNNLTRETLRRTIYVGHNRKNNRLRPKVTILNFKLDCLRGKHRIEAAKRVLKPPETWWTIQLFCLDTESFDAARFLSILEEKWGHETKFSDGEIYRKIRFYEDRNKKVLAEDWKLRLTESKRVNLKIFLQHPKFVKRFDKLRDFPGLWCGLELGNIRKHFAIRCDEELLHYLKFVYKVWKIITLRDASIRFAVDIQTVRSLELRAPLVSIVDRNFIIHGMDNNELFPLISDHQTRENIKQTLLGLPIIIPTIKSFHENAKILGIGAKIIKSLLFDNKLPRGTVYESMKSIWVRPEHIVVETRSGEFQNLDCPPNDNVVVALLYLEIFLCALRDFPDLSYDAPRKETGKKLLRGMPDPAYQLYFLTRAKSSGFSNQTILRGLGQPSPHGWPNYPEARNQRKGGESTKRRWGRPFSEAHAQCRPQLFLTNLARAKEETDINPSAMFVQQDLIGAYFGYNSNFDKNAATISHTMHPYLAAWNATPNTVQQGFVTVAPQRQLLGEQAVYTSDTRSLPLEPGDIGPRIDIIPVSVSSPLVHTEEPFSPPQRSMIGVTVSEGQQTENQGSDLPPLQSAFQTLDSTQEAPSGPPDSFVAEALATAMIPVSATSTYGRAFRSPRAVLSPGTMTDRSSLVDGSLESSHSRDSISSPHSRVSISSSLLDLSTRLRHSGFEAEAEEMNEQIEASRSLPTVDEHNDVVMSDASTVVELNARETSSDASTVLELGANEAKESSSDALNRIGRQRQHHRSFLQPKARSRRTSQDLGITSPVLPAPVSHERKRSYLMPGTRIDDPTRARVMQGRRSFLSPAIRQTRRTSNNDPTTATTDMTKQKGDLSVDAPQHPHLRASIGPKMSGALIIPAAVPQTTPLSQSKQGRRSFLKPQLRTPSTDHGNGKSSVKLIEFNGMNKSFKFTNNLADYLKQRKGWVGMIIEGRTAKTIRFDYILKYISEGKLHQEKELALVKAPYAEQFRTGLWKNARSIDDDAIASRGKLMKRLRS